VARVGIFFNVVGDVRVLRARGERDREEREEEKFFHRVLEMFS
jgi:hypothetical protein